jgi:hypothetical protein
VQYVADLLTVAEDGDVLAQARSNGEPCNPALVLDTELARPVDTRLPHGHSAKPIHPGIINTVLVGDPLGTSIRGMKVQAACFSDTGAKIFVLISAVSFNDIKILHFAVDLIGGGIDEVCLRTVDPHGVKQVEAAAGIDLKIFHWPGDRCRDHDLRGQEQEHIRPRCLEHLLHALPVSNVDMFKADVVAALQPLEVRVGAASRKIIDNDDSPTKLPKLALRCIFGEISGD